MRTLQEITDSAKQGDIISRKVLYYKYFYLVENYHEYYNFPYTELKSLYDKKFMQYMENDYVHPLQQYIYQAFYICYSVPVNALIDKPITYLIGEARKGNVKAREKLIKKYIFLVLEKAREYDYLDYDDLVQEGTIKLIETIDNCIKGSCYAIWAKIDRALDIFYMSTLMTKILNLKKSSEITDISLVNKAIEKAELLDNKILNMEVMDLLQNVEDEDAKIYFIDYLFNGDTYAQIASRYNRVIESVRKKVKKSTSEIRKSYR